MMLTLKQTPINAEGPRANPHISMPRAHTGERHCAEEVMLGKLDRHPYSGPETEPLFHTIYKDQPQTLKCPT